MLIPSFVTCAQQYCVTSLSHPLSQALFLSLGWILLANSWLLKKKRCCIIETLVRKDWSGKWSEHGRRARVIYNLETLETERTKDRSLNLRNFLHGSSNGIRTNALPYVPQKLGLFSRTTNMWQLSNLQIDSSVIQIVQSDVRRNSVDTTAAITNKYVPSFVDRVQDRARKYVENTQLNTQFMHHATCKVEYCSQKKVPSRRVSM